MNSLAVVLWGHRFLPGFLLKHKQVRKKFFWFLAYNGLLLQISEVSRVLCQTCSFLLTDPEMRKFRFFFFLILFMAGANVIIFHPICQILQFLHMWINTYETPIISWCNREHVAKAWVLWCSEQVLQLLIGHSVVLCWSGGVDFLKLSSFHNKASFQSYWDYHTTKELLKCVTLIM